MAFDKTHTEDECDKCLESVGKLNLYKVSFLYLDKNDNMHPNQTPIMLKQKRDELTRMFKGDKLLIEVCMAKVRIESGYRQYYVCKKCLKKC